MKTIILGSMAGNAGKTSMVVGLARATGKNPGYLKPFGDRLIYRKKRLWDYDSALVTGIFGLTASSEDMTIGFEHSKLRYMYDEEGTRNKVKEMVEKAAQTQDLLFIEGGKDLSYGASVRLDTLALARYTGGKLVIVISGDECVIADNIAFLKKYVDTTGVNFGGVIINKVINPEDFSNTHLDEIKETGIAVLGVIPYKEEMTQASMGYLADRLQSRIIAGESGLNKKVKRIFVGSMGGDAAARHPLWKTEHKLAITSGDRTDYIIAALESSTSGIILTNNVLPSQNIIARAADSNIPMLLVPTDTYETTRQIDKLDILLMKDDKVGIDLLQELVKKNVDLDKVLG
jgi:uncharacterized protein